MSKTIDPLYGRPCRGKSLSYWDQEEGGMCHDTVTGTFVAFGVDYEEKDYGVAPFSTAIVEEADGFLCSCKVDGFQFLDRGGVQTGLFDEAENNQPDDNAEEETT